MNKSKASISPWVWIPVLYFAEGIPYFIVNNISVIMFTNMGMTKGSMAMCTSLLYIPWVIKPLWSPFVDMLRTKRWWVVAMQAIMASSFAVSAFLLPVQTPVSGLSPFVAVLIVFWITALASATHDIAADGFYMLALSSGDQSLFVGIRSTFYRLSSIFGQGVLVVIAGLLESYLGNVPKAWSITLVGCSVLFALIALYNMKLLPKPEDDRPHFSSNFDFAGILKEFERTFRTFFTKKYIWTAMLFMLLYRLPEALLVKMMNPFFLDSISEGGLGISTAGVGLVYGTVGVAALTVGGIIGGVAASRYGLKKVLWPMAASLALPCFAFVYLSAFQPEQLWVIASCVALDQFGYGFGFTAYMLYMMYFAQGEYTTSHYSLCTAFMALSMMLPGMLAGYIQEIMGYQMFFWIVIICCFATFAVTALVKVDDKYGMKN